MRQKLIIILLILLYIKFFSYTGFDNVLWGRISRILALALSIILLFQSAYRPRTFVDKTVIMLMLVPWLSLIPAYVLHGQGFMDTTMVTMQNLTYSMYFLFSRPGYRKVNLEKILLIFGIAYCSIYIIQQFTYPTLIFSNSEFGDTSRGSNVRISLFGGEFCIILLFMAYSKVISQHKIIKPLVVFIIAIFTVYLMSVRQIYFTVAISLFLGLFLSKKIKFYQFSIVAIFAAIVYYNFDSWFGAFVEMSGKDDWSYEARSMSWAFYGITYNGGKILAILLGNGDPQTGTAYANEISSFQSMYGENIGLWREDIGIVGVYSVYGLVYVAVIAYFFYHVFKERKHIDLYLKLFALYMLMEMPAIQYFTGGSGNTAANIVALYLFQASLLKNKYGIDYWHKRKNTLKPTIL